MSAIYFIILLIFIPMKMLEAASSPVLIYGAKLQQRPVFPTIETTEFAEMMKNLQSEYAFVVFLEEKLQARQFSCKSITAEECFGDFPEGLNQYTFYGSVNEPFYALQSIFKEAEPIFMTGKGHLLNFTCEFDLLNRLNVAQGIEVTNKEMTLHAVRAEAMRDINKKIKDCKLQPIIFFIAMPTEDIVYKGDGEIKKFQVKSMSTSIKDGLIIVSVATKLHKMFEDAEAETKNITFRINEKIGHYTKVDAIYDGAIFKGKKLPWPKRFKPNAASMLFRNKNRVLKVNSLRLEHFSDDVFDFSENLKSEEELDWNTCVYVTPGILMGLFVTAILCSILYWGITMIMDIKTNDRFDGPNMKNLSMGPVEN